MAALLLSGCFSGASVTLPEVDGAKAILLVQEIDAETPRAIFVEPGAPPPALEAGPVWALYFDWSPEGLIDYGVPLSAARGVASQPLPAPQASFTAPRPDRVFEATSPPDGLRRLSLPRPDLVSCAARQGCISTADPLRCEAPCPEPAPPTPPEPVRFDCPETWTATTGPGGLSLCRPTVHPSAGCGDHEWQGAGASCAPLGVCGAGLWPEPPDGDGPLIYVDPAAAAGGDGTMAAPYRRMSDLPTLPASARVLIAAGRVRGGLRIDAPDVQIVGKCAAETWWHPSDPIVVVAAGVRISGVELEANPRAIEVGPTGGLTLSGARVWGGDPAILVEGRLSGAGLRMESDFAIAASGGTVALTEFEHRGDRLLTGAGADIDLEDFRSRASGGEASMIELETRPRITLRRGHFENTLRDALLVRGLPEAAAISDTAFVAVRGTAVNLIESEDPETSTDVLLERLYFEDMGDTAIRVSGARVTARHIVVFGARHIGLDLRQHPSLAGDVLLEQVWLRMDGEHAMRLGKADDRGAGLRLVGADWVVQATADEDEDVAAIDLREQADLALSRARIFTEDRPALRVVCGQGEATDLDIEVQRARAVGIQADEQFELRRVHVRGQPTAGVQWRGLSRCEAGRLAIEDARFEGCDTCTTGIDASPGQVLSLSRIDARRFDIGVDAHRGASLSLRSSVIEDNRVGLWISSGIDGASAVRGVKLNNARDLDVD